MSKTNKDALLLAVVAIFYVLKVPIGTLFYLSGNYQAVFNILVITTLLEVSFAVYMNKTN